MKILKLIQKIYNLFRLIQTHPLISNEKISALIRYITLHLRHKNGEKIAIPFCGGHLIILKGEGSNTHYFTYLEDYEEMFFLLHFLRDSDQFIDVGANIGAYSILAASQIGCKTIAIEPSEKNYSLLIKIDVEGFEEFVLKGAKQVLNHPDTHAVILELAGYNRYNSSDAKIHKLMIKNHFFPVQYFPEIREIKKLESFRIDQFNTIYIKNMKLVKKRIIDSPQYKIGSHWV